MLTRRRFLQAATLVGLLFVTGLSFAAAPVLYYVDCAANGDAGAGTSQAVDVAWKTIAKVNGSSFAAGDSILLKRGCTWREQLTVPSSGSAGSVITFGAYGTGAKPIINGADLVATWSAYTGVWETMYTSRRTASSAAETSPGKNFRAVVPSAEITGSASTIRVTIRAHATQNTVITGASIGLRSGTTDDFAGAPTRITFDGGSDAKTITAGETAVSDAITVGFASGSTYLVHIYTTAGTWYFWKFQDALNAVYYDFTGTDATLTVSWTSAGSFDKSAIDIIEGAALIWQAALVTEPKQVFFDGVKGTPVASIALCNGTGKWFWDTNVLYVYSATDPDSAYTAPGIEATVRDSAVVIDGQDYITVTGIHGTHVNDAAFHATDYVAAIFDGITASHASLAGVQFSATGGPSTGGVLRNSDISYSGFESTTVATGVDFEGVPGALAEHNDIHHNKIGLEFDQNSTDSIVRFNHIRDNDYNGVQINNADGSTVAYNLITGNGLVTTFGNGIYLFDSTAGTSTGNVVLSNVFSDNADGAVLVESEQTNLAIKNNILYKNHRRTDFYEIWLYSNRTFTGIAVDYNLYWHDCGNGYWDANAWQWSTDGGTKKTFAEWQALGFDAHGVVSDPLFVSATDFHLQAASPARDAGVDVGLTTDYAGRTVPQGSGVDIGAYEFGGQGPIRATRRHGFRVH